MHGGNKNRYRCVESRNIVSETRLAALSNRPSRGLRIATGNGIISEHGDSRMGSISHSIPPRRSPQVRCAMSLDQYDKSTLDVTEDPNMTVDQAERMDLLSLNFVALELREAAAKNLNDDFMDQETAEERMEEILHTTETMLEKNSTKNERRRSRRKMSSESVKLNPNSNDVNLDIISLDELAWHDCADDCWVAIYDYVYDCTEFVGSHPGGHDVLLEYAGRDATLAFIGTGHSIAARKLLEKYLIGELPTHERIFRINGGVKIVEQ